MASHFAVVAFMPLVVLHGYGLGEALPGHGGLVEWIFTPDHGAWVTFATSHALPMVLCILQSIYNK